MINTMKTYLKTKRPHRDDNGHKVKVLFLKDYVLYALLREKKDFTKCATDRFQAIAIALDWLKIVIKARHQLELNDLKNSYLKALKYKLDVDITLEDLVQLENAIKNQINTLNVEK